MRQGFALLGAWRRLLTCRRSDNDVASNLCFCIILALETHHVLIVIPRTDNLLIHDIGLTLQDDMPRKGILSTVFHLRSVVTLPRI